METLAMAPTLSRAGSDENVPELRRPQELDALFRRCNPLLSRLCMRWTRGNRADAQDLLAEAYLRAVRATFQGSLLPDNLIAWVSSIIANLARDQLRARSRGTRFLGNKSDVLETICDPHCASEALFATRELLAKTLDDLQRLCPMQRGALLARSAGEEYEAIAACLGTSPANARKLVQTARNQLRARVSPHERILMTGKRRHVIALASRVSVSPTRQ
jgi:RNA polymerase sigma factor (sigma-70 family)